MMNKTDVTNQSKRRPKHFLQIRSRKDTVENGDMPVRAA
jgi:hypothetical protein